IPVSLPSRLVALAERIDADRCRELLSELGSQDERALAVLLGTAFPALQPRWDWQLAELEFLFQRGFRSARRTRDLIERFAGIEGPQAMPALRRRLWAEKARIALRELLPVDLGGAPIEVTAGELSNLADAMCETALAEARNHVSVRFGEPR